ncbi:ABC transporter permease [Candidatus Atribacteria bacterium 1244-E10-H5-B2]|nr:MAG: ABC transporter permease [Candidatus Atribacteria bacterium 1244-E10-H5-B2]
MAKSNNDFFIDFEKLSRNRTILLVGRNWAFIFLTFMLILFSFLGKNFFGLKNFNNIILGVSSLLLLASGETFVIISGGIDLSIGFVMGFVCISSSIIMRDLNAAGYSPIISMMTGSLIGLLLGLIPGFINGFFVAKLRVPPFIATLGMWGIANGLAWRLCEGFPVGFLPLQVRDIGNAYLAYFSPKKGFSFLIKPELTEREDILNLVKVIPIPILLITFILIIFAFILSRTKFGQHTYAIGGKVDAAIRAGINVPLHLIKIYIISSFFAAAAGVLLVFKLNMGVHTQYTSSYELFAIAAVVIGGASLTGGKGTIWGTLIGVLLIGTLNNGLMMMGLPIFYRYIATGCILIIAILIDQFFPELVHRE